MNNYIILLALLFFSFNTMAQVDKVIIESDAQFDGLISVTADTNSVFIGTGAGISIDESFATLNTFIGASAGSDNTKGAYNVFLGGLTGLSNTIGRSNVMIGFQAGLFSEEGSGNVLIGENSGYKTSLGNDNTFLGTSSGFKNTSGNHNTYLGALSGFENLTGSRNVFIGYQAGQLELGSDKLYIANSSTATPLILGDFSNNTLEIHGAVNIKEFMTLTPTTAPGTPAIGTIYYDSTDNKVKVWTPAGWENLN